MFSRNGHTSGILEVFWSQSSLWGPSGVPSLCHAPSTAAGHLLLGNLAWKRNWKVFGVTLEKPQVERVVSEFQSLQVRCYQHLWCICDPADYLLLERHFVKGQMTRSRCLPALWYSEASNPLSSLLLHLLNVTWKCLFFFIPTATTLVQVTVYLQPSFLQKLPHQWRGHRSRAPGWTLTLKPI